MQIHAVQIGRQAILRHLDRDSSYEQRQLLLERAFKISKFPKFVRKMLLNTANIAPQSIAYN